MSRNVKEIYDDNPSASFVSTDLIYLGKSPYIGSSDSAIQVSDIYSATNMQLTAGKLDTIQGISTAASPTFAGLSLASPLGVTSGGTGLSATTANQLLYSSGANTIAGLSVTARSVLTANSSGVHSYVQLNNGQLVIGSTSGSPAAATLSPSGNISIGVGSNSISIGTTRTASLIFNAITTSQALQANVGFLATSGTLSFSLPAIAEVGDVFYVTLTGATSWTITQGAGQQIRLGNVQTTTGVGGSLASTAAGDSVYFVCDVANNHFVVLSVIGNITVV